MTSSIEVGFQVYVGEGTEAAGAVRELHPGGRPEFVVDIEGAGDFSVPLSAVLSVHDEKVVLDPEKIDPKLREAVRHAHDREDPNL